MRHLVIALFALSPSLFLTDANAEVLTAADAGFVTRHSVVVTASRGEVYAAFTTDIGKWWNADHTVSGIAASLYLEPRTMGCFCETLGPEAGLVHMTVTFVNPGVMLRLTGGLGPLGLMGVAGNLTFEFTDVEEGTEVTVQYAVGGYRPEGLAALAPAVDAVLIDAVERLERYVEQEPIE